VKGQGSRNEMERNAKTKKSIELLLISRIVVMFDNLLQCIQFAIRSDPIRSNPNEQLTSSIARAGLVGRPSVLEYRTQNVTFLLLLKNNGMFLFFQVFCRNKLK